MLWRQGDGFAWCSRRSGRLHALDGYLASRGLRQTGSSPPFRERERLRSDRLLVVGDLLGRCRSRSTAMIFAGCFETFVGHASVMLENWTARAFAMAQVNDLEGAASPPGLPATTCFHRPTEPRALHRARPGGSRARLGRGGGALHRPRRLQGNQRHARPMRSVTKCSSRSRASRPAVGAVRVTTAARLAGDEFAVLLEMTDGQGAEIVATCMLESIQRPIMLHGRETRLNSSIGIALSSAGMTADEVPAKRRRRDVFGEAVGQAPHCAVLRRRCTRRCGGGMSSPSRLQREARTG